jgi:hypothetical protein
MRALDHIAATPSPAPAEGMVKTLALTAATPLVDLGG